mgnify:CR=1 FL=1|jgi:putative prophage lambdaBa04, DNA binding protein
MQMPFDFYMEVEMEEIHKTVYQAEEIQEILNIGKNKVYEFLEDVYTNTHLFRVIKIGRLYRIPKKSFDEWLCKEEDRSD